MSSWRRDHSSKYQPEICKKEYSFCSIICSCTARKGEFVARWLSGGSERDRQQEEWKRRECWLTKKKAFKSVFSSSSYSAFWARSLFSPYTLYAANCSFYIGREEEGKGVGRSVCVDAVRVWGSILLWWTRSSVCQPVYPPNVVLGLDEHSVLQSCCRIWQRWCPRSMSCRFVPSAAF